VTRRASTEVAVDDVVARRRLRDSIRCSFIITAGD
jgi:hypothetical protein